MVRLSRKAESKTHAEELAGWSGSSKNT